MAKRSASHQNFKLTSHKHPKDRVLLYIVVAAVIGLAVGWLFQERFADILGMSAL